MESVRSLGRIFIDSLLDGGLGYEDEFRLYAPTVGFDRLFDLLENGLAANGGEGYPPFNIVREGDDRYRIDLAVAGFRPNEIEISAQQNMLVVTGRKGGGEEGHVLYRGIAGHDFERRFGLADHIQVRGADLKEGVLSIELMREIPEAMKPRKIEISSANVHAQATTSAN